MLLASYGKVKLFFDVYLLKIALLIHSFNCMNAIFWYNEVTHKHYKYVLLFSS